MVAEAVFQTKYDQAQEIKIERYFEKGKHGTEYIRAALRDQKREMQHLRHNKIFQEFKRKPAVKSENDDDEANTFLPAIVSTSEMEEGGKLGKTDAFRRGKALLGQTQRGVWCDVGAPYTCLGQPEEVEYNSLCPFSLKS